MASPIQQWIQQIGTSSDEDILSISLDSTGSIYLGGYTLGKLDENSVSRGFDGFLGKYSAEGEKLWLKQIGTESFDQISAVHADTGRAVYAAGFTAGQLEGQNQGQTDAFIVKYDALGNPLWRTQFGTTSSEGLRALATDPSGNLFVGGSTSGSFDGAPNSGNVDGFVGKYDPQGKQLWIRQLSNSAYDFVEGLCVDANGDVYVGGYTDGDFDGEADEIRSDGFIIKYSSQGDLIWIKNIGSENSDYVQAIAYSQQGNIYVGGFSSIRIGPEPQNTQDQAFVGKYNAQGEKLWFRQLGTSDFEGITSLDIDEKENVYVGGHTRRQLAENGHSGGDDAFLAKYNPEGTQLWFHQFGTKEDESTQALAVGPSGVIYVAGYTSGRISEERPQGGRDGFLAKYIQPKNPNTEPEPAPVLSPINHIPVNRPKFSEILPVQAQTVLDFLNKAQKPEDITAIEKHRPDLSQEALATYSIGEQSAQNLLEARAALPGEQFNKLEEVLDVRGIGEDKVLDIIEFIWLPTEEMFRQELFRELLGENWVVDYWRYAMNEEDYDLLEQNPPLLNDFVARRINEIARRRSGNYVVGSLAQALLEKSPSDRVESLTALTQFASWWFRFDEDNWFSFDRISALIDPFLNYYNRQAGAYIDPVFYRGFQNGGTVADGISPDDLVVTLNHVERAITIWGISLFD